jgi:dTDP-4-dehydrorhamnose 3,5-epimerase-like enzyme
MEPELLRGGLAVDDRGEVGFVNEFAFDDVKRFYTVSNHAVGFVRAWHGHQREAKYVLAVSGAALVCCVEVDDWESPSPALEV